MLMRHRVTFNHVMTVYHDVLDHIDGDVSSVSKKNVLWHETLYFDVKSP